MKYDRIQDTFRYITPGLYLLALILAMNFDAIKNDKSLQDAISRFSAIIIVLLPFVGFVFGYFIECIMAWVERLLYAIRLPRPSRVVLNGECCLYIIDDDVRKRITHGVKVDNKQANRYQQLAKQQVGDKEVISRGYNQSIMARHIFGAQLLGSIYYLAFAGGWSVCHLIYALLIVCLVGFFWYHQTCVYMKNLFAEFGKTLKPKDGAGEIDEDGDR